MRRLVALLGVGAVFLLVATPANARLHEVSVGNYYFEVDETGARNPIVVDEGDQIRYTVREGTYPAHSAVIQGYDPEYASPPLLLFQTFTTPPLHKPGTFVLFCRDHRDRGHETTLIVRAAAPQATATTSAPASTTTKKKTVAPTARRSPTPSPLAGQQTPAQAQPGTPDPSPASSLAPAGVGEATDRRRPPPEPDSLAGLLGRRFGGDLPWTTAVWVAALAALPIAAATVYALRRAFRRQEGTPPGS